MTPVSWMKVSSLQFIMMVLFTDLGMYGPAVTPPSYGLMLVVIFTCCNIAPIPFC